MLNGVRARALTGRIVLTGILCFDLTGCGWISRQIEKQSDQAAQVYQDKPLLFDPNQTSIDRTDLPAAFDLDTAHFPECRAQDPDQNSGKPAAVASTAAGAVQTPPAPPTTPDGAKPPAVATSNAEKNSDTSKNVASGDCKTAYEQAIGDSAARDRLQFLLLRRSDAICIIIKARIASFSDNVNFFFGEITTLLGGTGAIVTGATAARVLAGTAGISNASRAQVNEIYYQNTIKSAILASMDDLRSQKKLAMLANKGKSTEEYSVDAMLLDANEYNEDCSFASGVEHLKRVSDTVANTNDILNGKLATAQAALSKDQTTVAQYEADLAKIKKDPQDPVYNAALKALMSARAVESFDLKTIQDLKAQISVVQASPGGSNAASGPPSAPAAKPTTTAPDKAAPASPDKTAPAPTPTTP
jgi:hypothetical protein